MENPDYNTQQLRILNILRANNLMAAFMRKRKQQKDQLGPSAQLEDLVANTEMEIKKVDVIWFLQRGEGFSIDFEKTKAVEDSIRNTEVAIRKLKNDMLAWRASVAKTHRKM